MKKLKKQFDYKKLYLEKYKNLPNYYFLSCLFGISTLAVASAIIYAIAERLSNAEEFAIMLCIGLGGILVAFALASLVRFFSSISLSQKVVVADSLLSMNGNNTDSSEDELPEL